ncbi:hypothetical protein C1646_662731 [Rhizophagus diaphanus]|nr:hypothetical protein C1646_662731 [Rhizophagus diaphanus] [Rhizophagus sp. MUCL 43196]
MRRVDYAIKALEELICIPEGKQHQIAIGFAQVNKPILFQRLGRPTKPTRKQKADTAFREDYDYLYGIITTATEWYFLLYTTEGISCTSETECHVSLSLKKKRSRITKKREAGDGGYCWFIEGQGGC